MVDNDQSTIIEAPEVYKSIPTTPRVKTNDKMYLRKNVDFDTFDGHVMVNFIDYWIKLSGYHIHTKYCKFDNSETIFGPFEKMTFFGCTPYSNEQSGLNAETSLKGLKYDE